MSGSQSEAKSPPAVTTPSSTGLESEVARLRSQIGALRALQTTARWVTLGLVGVVVAEFALFVFFTKTGVESNFNPTAVQRAIAVRVPQVAPEVRDRLLAVTQHALPVYRDRAMQRFQEAGPEVARDAMARLQKLPEENGQELNRQVQGTFAEVLAKLEPDIHAAFPTLSSEKQTQILHDHFEADIAKQNAAIAAHVQTLSNAQLEAVRKVLVKFDIADADLEKVKGSRKREFLHALVDVMMDTDLGLDLGAPVVSERTVAIASDVKAPAISSNKPTTLPVGKVLGVDAPASVTP